VGALVQHGGVVKMAEAWDESITAPTVQHLRFHRET
jgi:hypothetical protein